MQPRRTVVVVERTRPQPVADPVAARPRHCGSSSASASGSSRQSARNSPQPREEPDAHRQRLVEGPEEPVARPARGRAAERGRARVVGAGQVPRRTRSAAVAGGGHRDEPPQVQVVVVDAEHVDDARRPGRPQPLEPGRLAREVPGRCAGAGLAEDLHRYPRSVAGLVIPAILHDGPGARPPAGTGSRGCPRSSTRAAARWDLTLGAPFTSGASSWCAPVLRADGSPARAEDLASRTTRRATRRPPCAPGTGAARPPCSARTPTTGRCCSNASSRARRWRCLRGARRTGWGAAAVARTLWAVPEVPDVPRMAEVCARWADVLEERAGRHDADPALVRHAADAPADVAGDGRLPGPRRPQPRQPARRRRGPVARDRPEADARRPGVRPVAAARAGGRPVRPRRPGRRPARGVRIGRGGPGPATASRRGRSPACTESAFWVWEVLDDEPVARRILRQAAQWARLVG